MMIVDQHGHSRCAIKMRSSSKKKNAGARSGECLMIVRHGLIVASVHRHKSARKLLGQHTTDNKQKHTKNESTSIYFNIMSDQVQLHSSIDAYAHSAGVRMSHRRTTTTTYVYGCRNKRISHTEHLMFHSIHSKLEITCFFFNVSSLYCCPVLYTVCTVQ